jgi:putative endonuclease
MMFWRRSGQHKEQSVWKRGERAAEKHLKRNGIRTLARNYRLPQGEIDLLCLERQTGTIIVVEVKSRKYTSDVPTNIDPSANITAKKRAKLITLAKSIKKMPQYRDRPVRIDAVSVRFLPDHRKPSVRHYPGCVSDS